MLARLTRWAVISAFSADDGNHQTAELSYLGKKGAKSAAIWPYGMNGWAPVGTQAFMWTASGDQDNRAHMPISRDERYRVKAPGEVVFGNPITGDRVYFKADGTIEIVSSTSVKIDAPNTEITGDLTIGGNLAVAGNSVFTGTIDANGVLNANSDLNDQNGIELSGHVHTKGGSGDTLPPKDP